MKDKARTNKSSLISVGFPKENPKDGSLIVDVKSIVKQFVISINKETGTLETKPLDRKNDFMSKIVCHHFRVEEKIHLATYGPRLFCSHPMMR